MDDSKRGFEFREIKVRWQIFNDLDFAPHYNIAPTQTHPIIVQRAGTVEARPMRWGLVPFGPVREDRVAGRDGPRVACPVFVRTVQPITKVCAFGGVTENVKGEALGFPPWLLFGPLR